MSTIAMSDTCRVGVQFDAGRFDFVLPADVAAAAVILSIVDHVVVATATSHDERVAPADWQLSRLDGSLLASRESLRSNGIRDGDILWLSRFRTAAARPRDDAFSEIAASLDASPRWTAMASVVAAAVIFVFCTGLVGYGLLRYERQQGAHTSAIFAAVLCASSFIAALAAGRALRETVEATALGCCATAYAALAGYLAVPGDPAAPKLMLAASTSATVAVLAARYPGCGTRIFVAAAAFGYLAAAAACAHLFIAGGTDATGAILGAAAMVMLALAARLSMWLGRLQVPRLSGDIADVARHAHAIGTGLICGFSAAAVAGATLAVSGGEANGAVFAAIVGLVLILRTGTHADLVQTATLMACGTAAFAVVFLRAVDAWPRHANWVCLGAVGIAAGAATLLTAPRPAITSPLTRRCLELAEYAALAAVIPAACWVAGVFGTVRGMA